VPQNNALFELKKTLYELLQRSEKVIFVGVGNEFRMDDGAGIKLVRELMKDKNIQQKKNILFFDVGLSLLNTLPTILSEKPNAIILVDSVKLIPSSSECEKTTHPFLFFSLSNSKQEQILKFSSSTHHLSSEFIKNYVAYLSPKTHIFLLGIPFERLEPTEELTLSPAVDTLVKKLATFIKEILLDQNHFKRKA